MCTLTDYTEPKQTLALKSHGAFFAWSRKQIDEQLKDGIKYCWIMQGLLCPTDKADSLVNELAKIQRDGFDHDLAVNGKTAIIKRELANHECQITGDYSVVVEKLSDYPITEQEIEAQWDEFMAHCIENDYF